METAVERLIDADDREELARLFRAGALSEIPGPVKAGWAFRAAQLGRAGMLRLIVERAGGLPPDKDERGQTLLHAAASSGDADTMAFALRVLGLDALTGDPRGFTPLDAAAQAGPGALSALEALCGVRLADCYRNPVRRGFYPDPSVVRVGSDYYMVNSSFVMVPALPISHSLDLVHWETIGHVLTDPDTARLRGMRGGFGYWAPDISYDRGRFWVTATLRADRMPMRTQMITSAPSPEGPWDEPRFLEVDGIDPSIFTDDDGRRYLLTNPGAQITPLSENGELAGETRMLWYGWNRIKSEGPHLLKKDGWYYLFVAEGGTGFGHAESCARSRSLYGPYESCPFNPILLERDAEAKIRRGGHGKPVRLPDGRWAFVYLCGRQVEGQTLMGRETAVDPLEWTADGWPMVNRLKGPSCLQKKLLPDKPLGLNESWVCPRLRPEDFSARDGDGSLRLTGGAALSDLRDAHLMLRRLREAQASLSAEADVSRMETGGIAGLTGYYDENSWFLFGLRKAPEGAELALIQRIGPEETEESLGRLPAASGRLEIAVDGLICTAACAGCAKQFRIAYLTDEGLAMGKRFTGALTGLAAVGAGEAVFRSIQEEMRDEQG